MIRYAMGAGFALLLCAVTLLAKEYNDAVVKSVDPDKGTITVTIKADDKDKDVTLKVDKDAKITRKGKDGDVDVKDGLKNEKAWGKNEQGDFPKVILTTEGEGDKEVVKTIKFAPRKKT